MTIEPLAVWTVGALSNRTGFEGSSIEYALTEGEDDMSIPVRSSRPFAEGAFQRGPWVNTAVLFKVGREFKSKMFKYQLLLLYWPVVRNRKLPSTMIVRRGVT